MVGSFPRLVRNLRKQAERDARAAAIETALRNLLDEQHAGDCECDRGIGPSMTHPGEPPGGPPCVFCEARAALDDGSKHDRDAGGNCAD